MQQPAVRTRRAVLVALFAALTAVGAFVRVPWFGWNLAVYLPLDLLKAALLLPVLRLTRARGGLVAGR